MGNFDRKMEYLKLVCDTLNSGNIKQYMGLGNKGQPEYHEWKPSSDIFFSIISDLRAYNYLREKKLINTGVCPDCGEFPIDATYTFTSGFNPNIKYNLCRNCYKAGNQMSTNPENKKSGCYIATVCYGNENTPEVQFFKQYRDKILLNEFFGKFAVMMYYFLSPSFARYLRKSQKLNLWIKHEILDKVFKHLRNKYPNL